MSIDDAEKSAIRGDFRAAVNMAPKELEDWLATEESQSVGSSPDGGEAVGHAMGRRIVELRRTRQADLGEDDYRDMRKVVGYVHRHMAQGGPREDAEHSRWRYSLMNWGHDPLK